jgi:hypothetical protein
VRHILIFVAVGVFAFALGFGTKAAIQGNSDRREVATTPPRPPLTDERIQTAVAGAAPTQKLPAWLALADEASGSADWKRLFEAAKVDPIECDLIVRKWIEADAEGCWDFLTSLNYAMFREAGTEAMKTWAMVDPEAAFGAAEALSTLNRDRDDFRWMVTRSGLEHHSIERMAPLVRQMHDANSVRSNARVNRWVQRDPEAAARFLASLPPSRARVGISDAVGAWIANDPDAALAWGQSQPANVRRLVLSKFVQSQRDGEKVSPQELLDLALTTTSGKLRSTLALGAVTDLAKTDPEFAFNWAAQHLKRSNLKSIGEGLMRVAGRRPNERSPESLMELVSNLPPSPARAGAAKRLAYNRIGSDPDGTIAWLQSLDPASQDVAFQSLALNFPTQSAMEWLTTAPVSKFAKDTLEETTEDILEDSGSDAAAEWAKSLPIERAAFVAEQIKKELARQESISP